MSELTRKEVIRELKNYFNIRELACSHTYASYGASAWQFFDTKILHTLLVIRRDILKTPMVINYGGSYQRGFRCNLCQLVKDKTLTGRLYITAHGLGKAFDASMKTMTGEQARQKIKANQHLLPYPIRMEKGVSWLHVDVRDTHENYEKVIEFTA